MAKKRSLNKGKHIHSSAEHLITYYKVFNHHHQSTLHSHSNTHKHKFMLSDCMAYKKWLMRI